MALNLDEAVQGCPAAGDGPEDAQATGDACVDATHERVVHYVERVDASLERKPLMEPEVAAQAEVGLVDTRVADTIDEQRHDARLVGAGLRAGSLVPPRGARLAERNHRVARARLGRCQHAAGGIEPLSDRGTVDFDLARIAGIEGVRHANQRAHLILVSAGNGPATYDGGGNHAVHPLAALAERQIVDPGDR